MGTQFKKIDLDSKKIDMQSVLYETEIKVNKFSVIFAGLSCFVDLLFMILIACGVFWMNEKACFYFYGSVFVLESIAIIIGVISKFQPKWLKYFLMSCLLVSVGLTAIWNGYGFWLVFAIPLLVSGLYFNITFTIFTAVASEIILALSIYFGALVGVSFSWIDVNLINISNLVINAENGISNAVINSSDFSFNDYLKSLYLIVYLPESFFILLLSLTGLHGANYGKTMVIEESEILAAKTKAEKEAADSKTQIMISQIQPHFIYNTLNSIYYLCDKEPETAKKAISEFSDYLRTNLNFMDKKAYVSFEQELEHIKRYLSLEKMRFEDELKIEYDIQCTTFKLPALSIQPLIENAVKHGVCKKQGGGTVKIWSRDALSHFEIGIDDDGVGFDVNKPFDDNRRHIGLENTKARLNDMCNATIEITSEIGVGTKVLIKLPKENYYEDSSSR